MSIKEQISNDIKEAMRSKDSFKRDTLRLISSVFKQVEVDERTQITDEKAFEILQKELKKRSESAKIYAEANRSELAKKELDEMDIIKSYLPKQLSNDELKAEISAIIKELNAANLKDLGRVIAKSREKIGAKSEARLISEVAKELLKNLGE